VAHGTPVRLSAPLFWYPYFKAEPPYVLTYARVEGEPQLRSHYEA
jgi:hypothetical protein